MEQFQKSFEKVLGSWAVVSDIFDISFSKEDYKNAWKRFRKFFEIFSENFKEGVEKNSRNFETRFRKVDVFCFYTFRRLFFKGRVWKFFDNFLRTF